MISFLVLMENEIARTKQIVRAILFTESEVDLFSYDTATTEKLDDGTE